MSFVKDLGMRVRTVRMDLGWSQDRLAESTGFAQAQLSRWEMGERSMTVEQLVIIADAMGLEAATLLPGSTPPQPSVAIATSVRDNPRWIASICNARTFAAHPDVISTYVSGPTG